MSTLAYLRRKRWEATHDIYGNNEAEQAAIAEMWREQDERVRQTVQAAKEKRKRRMARGEEWLRPMGIDEAYVPGTRVVYDYGRDVDNHDFSHDDLAVTVNFNASGVL